MPMLFRFENAQTIFSPQFIKALGGICSRFAFRNANLLPSALATDSLTSTFSLYVFLIFLFVFLCLLSCLLLLHQVNVQRRFAKQIFLYLFISNVARISPLCVLCFVCCVWLSNPLLTKYSLNSWTGTINPYQAVRTQILCFVFRSLSFKKKHAISPLLRPLVVVRYSTRWIAKLRLQYVPNSIVHASLIYKSIFIYVIWCCIAKQQQR